MKLYRRFLASYLCVCIIPLAFSLFVVANMRLEIQKSIARDQEVTLQAAQSDLENCLVEASNTLDLLSENELLESLALKDSISGADLYDLCKMIPALESAEAHRSSYISCFAYFPENGYFVSNKSTYHPQLAGISTWDLDVDYQTLLSVLETGGVNVDVQTIYRDDSSSGYVLVWKNCFDNRYQTMYASLGILIELDREDSFLDTDTSKMFVLDEDGRLLCGSSSAREAIAQMESSGASSGSLRLNQENWLYSVYPEQTLSDLRYGLLVNSSVYYRSLQPLLWQLAALLVVIAAGVTLAVLLSRRTWSPFQQVLPFVEKSDSGAKDKFRSLAEFSQALAEFAQEKEQLLKQLSQSKARDSDMALWRYLLGFSQDSSCLSRYLEENQPYRLLVFSLAETERTPREEGSRAAAALGRKLPQVLEQLFLDRGDGVCLTIDATREAVLVQEEMDLDSLREKTAQAQKALGLSLVCYASDECLHLTDAPKAWDWVRRAYDRDLFWQASRESGVFVAQELLEYPSHFGDFLQRRKQLFTAITSGNAKKASVCFETILKKDLLNPNLPLELIRRRCAHLVETLTPYLENYDGPDPQSIISAPTIWKMEEALRKLFQSVKLGTITGKAEEEGSQLVAQVQAYIRENYQDPALNVSLIADRLNRNLSTLSHQYKDLTGHGLLEDLHAVRLEAAKKLLKEGKTVRETAELTGYGDSRALIRAFKRYEGSTPGQYIDKK